MAFQKTFAHNSGINVTYWKIAKVDTNYATKIGTITLYGYINQESRDGGNNPLMIKKIDFRNAEEAPVFDTWFSVTKINGSGKNPVKNAYEYLKTISDGEFSDATDILD